MEVINDFNTSVEKAFDEIDLKWRDYPGLVICGTHKPRNIEEYIVRIRVARENGVPFLGICAGLQMAVIEYCRFKGIKDATSQEYDPNHPSSVIVKLPELRVGIRRVKYWLGSGYESHWHNYTVSMEANEILLDDFNVWGDAVENVVEALKHKTHPYFVGVQFHPEYQSSKDKPHPLLIEFLDVCRKSGNVE